MAGRPLSFVDAWVDAATGPDGFWSTAVPSAHFRTASTLGPEVASAVAAVLRQRPGLQRVVELGAGDGALLARLRADRPDLVLVGVDLRDRPPGLHPAIHWCTDRWDVRSGAWVGGTVPGLWADGVPTLVLAIEWLDDLPCPLAARDSDGWWELDTDLAPLAPLAAADRAWVQRWWPAGARVEVGTTRDAAWATVVAGLACAGGAALLVDYGHRRAERPRTGSLAGYRAGRVVEARPLPDRNLTAHVALDAVEHAGTTAGGRTVLAGRQAEVLPRLLSPLPAGAEPLAALAARSRRRALTAGPGWGSHGWLLQEVPGGAVAP